MQTIRVTAARHDTSGKLIDNQNLIVLYHVILIPEHQIVGTQSKNDIMLNLQILRICQVFNMEILLNTLYAIRSQIDNLILFIDDKVTGLLNLFAQNCIHLAEFTAGFAALHASCKNITNLIKFGGLAALAGNDKRSTRFVDQYRVHLIDDGIVEFSLHQLFFVNLHIITQIIKTQLIIGDISNITTVCCTALFIGVAVQNHAYGQAQKFMHLSHPCRISVCQVIIDGNDVYALSFQCIQIRRKC